MYNVNTETRVFFLTVKQKEESRENMLLYYYDNNLFISSTVRDNNVINKWMLSRAVRNVWQK